MSAESAFYQAINVAGITALVSTRIYPDALPEGCAYPAIVFTRESTEAIVTIGGVKLADDVTFTISAWAETRTAADAVADALEVALRAAGHGVTGRDGGFDSETGLLASTITATVLA